MKILEKIDRYLAEAEEKRWAYGTKDNKWHLIGPDDRDFKSAITQKEFKKIGKAAAKKKYLNEGNDSLDSQYLQKAIKDVIRDIKKDPDEKMMVPALKMVASRLNQSYPDGDVTQETIFDILKEPGSRGVMKKAGTSAYEIIEFIWM